MNTSLLVVPALAGYWVLSRTYITHFVVDRHVGYRFIFETALVGLGILAAAHILVRVAAHFLPCVAWLEDGKWAWAKEIVSNSRFDPQVYRAHVSAPAEPGRAD